MPSDLHRKVHPVLAGTPTAGNAARLNDREVERLLPHYEGLVFRTAQLLVSGEHPDCHQGRGVEQEEDDVRQVLRMRVLYMLRRYDPSKVKKKHTGQQRYGSRTPADKARDAYVNMGVRDASKDIAKRKRRGELLIDDIAPTCGNSSGDNRDLRDRFDQRYLSVEADEAFAEVEDEFPDLPNTLTGRERAVMSLMYQDFKQTEISGILGITKREVESAVRGVRTKMADWRPSVSSPEHDYHEEILNVR